MDQATHLRRIVKGESAKIIGFKQNIKNGSFSTTKSPRVFSVTSGKGGVGKTNIVGNLAIACQRMGKKVLIFDADLGLANIDIIYGFKSEHNIDEVIRGEKDLSQIIVKGPEGVSVIPACSGVQELANLSEGHKINLLNEFDNLNRMYDILLIDTGAGISSNVIYFNLAAQERIIVLTPEPTSITDAYALLKVMFYKHGTRSFTLLINMARDEKEAKSVYENLIKVVDRFLGDISIGYAGYIPKDDFLVKAVGKREPILCCYPKAPSCKNFNQLAEYLLNQTHGRPVDGNIKFLWKRLMGQTAG
jgi:flagellar biosynthesis protein FlhG